MMDHHHSSSKSTAHPGSLSEVFSDLDLRFLSSLSPSDVDQGNERVFFQLEQAWWRYEDALADNFDHLPHFKKFESFAREMCRRSPRLAQAMLPRFDELYRKFKDYVRCWPCLLFIRLDLLLPGLFSSSTCWLLVYWLSVS